MSTIENDDLFWLSNCGKWPNWPFCPVKNSTDKIKEAVGEENNWGGPVCGLVFDNTPLRERVAKATPTVYILNMFAGWTEEQFKSAKKFEYESIKAMLADGWVVD